VSIDKQALLDAIVESEGYVSRAADSLGCTTRTILNHSDPEIADAIALARKARHQEMVDIAEQALMKLVEAGDRRAIKFVLDTQGKTRRYDLTEKEGQFRLVRIDNGIEPATT
jgi:hypothetical protein